MSMQDHRFMQPGTKPIPVSVRAGATIDEVIRAANVPPLENSVISQGGRRVSGQHLAEAGSTVMRMPAAGLG